MPATDETPEEFLTVDETIDRIAARFGVKLSARTVHDYIASGLLKGVRIGTVLRIRGSSVRGYMDDPPPSRATRTKQGLAAQSPAPPQAATRRQRGRAGARA